TSAGARPSGLSSSIGDGSVLQNNSTTQSPAPQALPATCYQALVDPNVDGDGGQPPNFPAWPVYDDKSYYTGDFYTTPPYSFVMIEKGSSAYNNIDADDNVFSAGGTDIDSFGQVFTV